MKKKTFINTHSYLEACTVFKKYVKMYFRFVIIRFLCLLNTINNLIDYHIYVNKYLFGDLTCQMKNAHFNRSKCRYVCVCFCLPIVTNIDPTTGLYRSPLASYQVPFWKITETFTPQLQQRK